MTWNPLAWCRRRRDERWLNALSAERSHYAKTWFSAESLAALDRAFEPSRIWIRQMTERREKFARLARESAHVVFGDITSDLHFTFPADKGSMIRLRIPQRFRYDPTIAIEKAALDVTDSTHHSPKIIDGWVGRDLSTGVQ